LNKAASPLIIRGEIRQPAANKKLNPFRRTDKNGHIFPLNDRKRPHDLANEWFLTRTSGDKKPIDVSRCIASRFLAGKGDAAE